MTTLTTIIYEGNFRKILNESSWFINYQNKFISKKRLNINNIESKEDFEIIIKRIEGIPNIEICFVDDNIDKVNSILNLDISRNTFGFNYTMPYLCDLISCTTDYIFNVSSDCQSEINITEDFFRNSIELLENDDSVIITTVPWGKPAMFKSVGEWEQNSFNINKMNRLFWFSKVMSDQLFFAKVDKILACDLNRQGGFHPYPEYGGFCFEKRIGNYLITDDKYRAIFSGNDYYLHGSD